MHNFTRIIAAIFIMACFSVSLAAQGFAGQLFKPASKAVALKRSADKTVLRQRLVALDAEVLAAAIGVEQKATGRGAAATTLDVDLFDGLKVSLTRTGSSESPEGGVVWQASAPGDGYAAFAVESGTLVGVIETRNRTFLIDPAGGGNHLLREIDASAYMRDKHIERPKSPVSALGGAAAAPRATTTYIDLLVAYTSRAQATMTSGGATVGQMADRDVAIVNTGMKNSGIPVRIRRKGPVAVSSTYDENTADPVQPLYDVTMGNNANFPAIRNTRNTVKADLVVLYMRQQPQHYCGVAWVNGPTPTATYGFAAVDAACLGSVTLAHELGHAMGLYHDRYVSAPAGTSVYNYGYVSTGGGFRDIMSYSNKCYAVLGHDCTLKVYYSSPDKFYNGRRAGRPQGTKGAADATRWLKAKRSTVAGFR